MDMMLKSISPCSEVEYAALLLFSDVLSHFLVDMCRATDVIGRNCLHLLAEQPRSICALEARAGICEHDLTDSEGSDRSEDEDENDYAGDGVPENEALICAEYILHQLEHEEIAMNAQSSDSGEIDIPLLLSVRSDLLRKKDEVGSIEIA